MAGLTIENWLTFGRDLAANTGFVLSDLDDAELSPLLRVGAGVFAAARAEVLARQDADRTDWVGACEFEATLQDDDDATRDLLAATELLDVLDVCELALSYIEDGAPHTAAERLRAVISRARRGTPPPIAAAERSAISYPADWLPAPFQLGQTVFLRDSGNRRFLVVGLEFNRGIASGDWWDVGVVERLRDITVKQYSARELSAEPLIDDDADYQDYREAGGALDWHAWRACFDRYRELLPTTWREPAAPEPPELTEIKRVLLFNDE